MKKVFDRLDDEHPPHQEPPSRWMSIVATQRELDVKVYTPYTVKYRCLPAASGARSSLRSAEAKVKTE